MTDLTQSPTKALSLRSRRFKAPPDDDPITAIIARGRKGEDARKEILSVAEEVAKGTKRRVVLGRKA